MATVALVTGANKGIGRQIALGLARAGHVVLASSRDRVRGERAVAELSAEGGEFPHAFQHVPLDVTDESSVRAAAGWIDERFGRLDILVNNAGITDRNDEGGFPPSHTDLAAMRDVYATNVFGVVAVTNAMLPLLRRAPAGRVVNLSTGLASITVNAAPGSPLPLYLAYASSKAALNAITVQYARELRDTAITVNACAPGKCATDLNGHQGARTAAQGAAVVLRLTALDDDVPTGGFFDENGPLPW